MKKFTINTSTYEIIKDMSDQDLGMLFRAMFEYHVNDVTIPPPSISIPFKLFALQFEKDRQVSEVRAMAGKQKQKPTKPNKTKQNQHVNQSLTISERKIAFGKSLEEFSTQYGRDTLQAFYKYWSEANKSGTKMRFELQKTWETSLRLGTWARNDRDFGSSTPITETNITKI